MGFGKGHRTEQHDEHYPHLTVAERGMAQTEGRMTAMYLLHEQRNTNALLTELSAEQRHTNALLTELLRLA